MDVPGSRDDQELRFALESFIQNCSTILLDLFIIVRKKRVFTDLNNLSESIEEF